MPPKQQRKQKAKPKRNNNNVKKKKPANRRNTQPRNRTRGLASQTGRLVGSLFGPIGGTVGSAAGQLFSKLTGVGDYKVSGNSLMSSMDRLPSFRNMSTGTRLQHREFLFDLFTSPVTGAFQIQKVPIQPALAISFPWLSAIAENYQEYTLHGVVFEYKTMSYDAISSSTPTSGTVIMATNYNVLDPDFINKIQMEQNQFTCSGKPSHDLLHPIECLKPVTPTSTLYTRAALNPGDLRLYDWGNFYVATVGAQSASANIGEIWVTYDITLYKPKLGQSVDVYDHYQLNGPDIELGGPFYFGVATNPPVKTPVSDMGTFLTASLPGNGLDTINWPTTYRGNVGIIYYAYATPATPSAYQSGLSINLSINVNFLEILANGTAQQSASTQGPTGLMTLPLQSGMSYTIFLTINGGGFVTFAGGSSTTPAIIVGDLIVFALPSAITNTFPGPLRPLPPSERKTIRNDPWISVNYDTFPSSVGKTSIATDRSTSASRTASPLSLRK